MSGPLQAPGHHKAFAQALLASCQPLCRSPAERAGGYLGIEPARNPDGSGVAVVYWKDHESILAFARDPEHMIVKRKGREIWYSHYMIRICKVERDYGRPEE